MSFEGKTVVVTGAGSGIGRVTALGFARLGAVTHVVDIANADKTAGEDAGRGKLVAHDLDVTDAQGWDRLASELAENGVDVLASVHGVLSQGLDTATDQTVDGWNRLVGINLTGTWLGIRALLPLMISGGRGGAMVVTTSGAALGGINGLAGYAASKGGLISLIKQVAVDYAPAGVRVNGVAPGIVATPMLGPMPKDFLDSITAQTPLGRLGQPEDIANAIHFLASEQAGFITGQILGIDGGLLSQAVAPVAPPV